MSDTDILADAEASMGEPSARARAGTFCVRVWQHMRLVTGGAARVCCAYQGKNITQDGVPVSTDRQSLMEIWNADTLRELRREMVAGRRVAGCRECYTVEDRGGISVRLKDNMLWEQGRPNASRPTFDAMMAQAVDNDFRLPKLPAVIEMEVGNLCNLKCRMCNSFSSSRIAKDPVQRKWNGIRYATYDNPNVEIDPGKIRRVGPIENLFDELAKDTGSQVEVLYFLGGEPFLVQEIPRLLERLVAAGRSRFLSLLIVSNGSIVPEWLSLAAQFHRVYLTISVDGYADHFEYIRYPGRWSKLARNLELFKKIPNVLLTVSTTVQVNNALSVTNLFRYLDSAEINFTGYLLHHPRHLAVDALPASIRRLGAARLRDYAEADCRSRHCALVLSMAAEFEAGDDSVDPRRLRDLMLFTNDMDASRGESIHRVDPELVALLEQAGFPWIDETLHTPLPDATAQQPHRPNHPPMQAQNEALKLHRDLSMTIKSLRDELSQNRAETTQTRDEIAQTHNELTQTNDELRQTRNELKQTHSELKRARDELAQTRDERAQMRDDLAQAHNELAQTLHGLRLTEQHTAGLRQQLADIYASRSWRATRLLRAAGQILRRSSPGTRLPTDPNTR